MGLSTTTNDAKLRQQGLVVLPTNPYVRASNVFVPTGFLIWPIFCFFRLSILANFFAKTRMESSFLGRKFLGNASAFFCGKMRFAPKLGST